MLDFLIFYEVKNREFESIVLLRNELVKRGYRVDYVSFFQINDVKTARKYRNKVKVAVMPSLYHDTEVMEIVYYIAGRVENIVNLRWEQVYTNATEVDKNYYVYPKDSAQKALHCCWGEKPRQLLRAVGIKDENISITGPMQMDLLNARFRKYYMGKNELLGRYEIPQGKPCVLFISSFSVSTFSDEERDRYVLQFEPEERQAYLQFVKEQKKTREIIFRWLTDLSKQYDCTVVYRPHPVELETAELLRMKEEKNIRVIAEENVKQWIKVCDQVYTWYSTSAAEAYFSDVPCVILRPVELTYENDLPIYRNVRFITDEREFFRCFEDISEGKAVKSGFDGRIMEEYYDCKQERPAYVRTADYLESVLGGSYRFPWEELKENLRMRSCKKDAAMVFKSLCWGMAGRFGRKKLVKRLLPAGLMDSLEKRMERHRALVQDNGKKVISRDEFEKMQDRLRHFCMENEKQ